MDFALLKQGLPILLQGAAMTLAVSLLSIVIATIGGFFMALLRLSHSKILRALAFMYIWIFRGTPLLLVLYLTYYVTWFGIRLPAFTAALLGMSLNATAYKAEIIRAGIMAVPKGQVEAAEAIGMAPLQVMRRIIIPQTVRLIIPPYISNAILVLKESAQISVITVPDLMLNAQNLYSSTYVVSSTLVVAGFLYLFMTSGLMLLQTWTEKKLKVQSNNK